MSIPHRNGGRARLAAALGLTLTAGCQQDERRRTEPADPAAVQGPLPAPSAAFETPTIGRVKDEPALFFGKEVRLAGEVDEVFDERAFELEGSSWAFGEDIAVLAPTPVRFGEAPLARGDVLIVTGFVRPFGAAQLERDLGWTVPDVLARRLQERPVLVAGSIRKVVQFGPDLSWDPGGEVRGAAPIATVFAITVEADDALLDREVNLRSEQVRALAGRGLWVGPSHKNQVFVVPRTPLPGIEAGDQVHVSGTLRALPRGAARAWEVPRDMASALLEQSLYVDAVELRELAPPGRRPGT